jgi:hypothetical protein
VYVYTVEVFMFAAIYVPEREQVANFKKFEFVPCE